MCTSATFRYLSNPARHCLSEHLQDSNKSIVLTLSWFHGPVNTSIFQPPNQAHQFSPAFHPLRRLAYVATPLGGHQPQSVAGYEPYLPIGSRPKGWGHPTHTKTYRGFPSDVSWEPHRLPWAPTGPRVKSCGNPGLNPT